MGLKTQLSDFLLQKLEHQAPPVVDSGFEPSLPSRILDIDEPHPDGEPLPQSKDAEGQTFVIAYVNGQGAESRRRILVRALKRTSDDRILLVARCTETRKEMHFRADRIKHCVDINGEVHDRPAAFLADVFNLDPVEAGLLAAEDFMPPVKLPPADTVYSLLRRQLGHDLTLMAAMAESDGQISMIEADAILHFVRRRSDLFGIDLDETRVRKLLGFLRRVRPTEDQIRESLNEIGERSPQAQLDVLTACRDVMLADGEIHASEARLLDQICDDLVDG
jgi:uncharacterized tellurite resistance protein B-like protein